MSRNTFALALLLLAAPVAGCAGAGASIDGTDDVEVTEQLDQVASPLVGAPGATDTGRNGDGAAAGRGGAPDPRTNSASDQKTQGQPSPGTDCMDPDPSPWNQKTNTSNDT